MIRFRRIEIENFVCFESILIEPSIDPERPLTIIRAENGTGKTTLLRAILWGMYGELSLPASSRDFRIHLAEWEPDDNGMQTSVKIEFENDGTTRSNSQIQNQTTRYQLIRQVTTLKPASSHVSTRNFQRVNEQSQLMLRSSDGDWSPHEHGVDTVIEQLLPKGLQEFFVMDADQVVDFVGGSSENKIIKRREVKQKTTEALHSLLGIDVFLETSKRLTRISREFGASAAKTVGSADLEKLQQDLEQLRDEQDKLKENLRGEREEKDDAESQLAICDDQLGEIIQRVGKLEGLGERLSTIKSEIVDLVNSRDEIFGKLCSLLESNTLRASVATLEVNDTFEVLKPLHDQGKIPQRHLAFVKELLREGSCICGQDLTYGPGKRKVEEMLNEATKGQDRSDFLGNLYDSARALMSPDFGARWVEERQELSGQLAQVLQRIDDLELDQIDIESKINHAGSEEVQLLQAERGILRSKIEELNKRIGAYEAREPDLSRKIESTQKTIDQRRRSEGAAKEERQAEQLTLLVEKIIRAAYDRILCDQVDDLSKRMNRLFALMAENADENDSSDFSERRATLKMITEVGIHQVGEESFEIFAKNKHNYEMPPTEINGASRRVLALAFVLALSKESQTNAPLVADSLLNFMSGAVRRNTLRITSDQSSQPILLLTGSDLESYSEVETVNRYAGATYTLTAQWQARELNGGGDVVRQTLPRSLALLCECGPREYCDICERESQANSPGWTKRI